MKEQKNLFPLHSLPASATIRRFPSNHGDFNSGIENRSCGSCEHVISVIFLPKISDTLKDYMVNVFLEILQT